MRSAGSLTSLGESASELLGVKEAQAGRWTSIAQVMDLYWSYVVGARRRERCIVCCTSSRHASH
jgi:hypothetical protein